MARPKKNTSTDEPRFPGRPQTERVSELVDGNGCADAIRDCLGALRGLSPADREWVLFSIGRYPFEGKNGPGPVSRKPAFGGTDEPALAE